MLEMIEQSEKTAGAKFPGLGLIALDRSPLAIDLFCGLGGWTEALLAEGYDVIGFDIERHEYGDHRYPGQLVIQNVRTLHGSQFRDATLIVASPPCQAYSYRAMPWKRAKALPPPDNTLFEACFRIQREACDAAGRHVPLIVENVRGAQKYVGRARWNYGSFYLWGDVPALMPRALRVAKRPGHDWNRFKETGEVSPHWRLNGEDSAIKNTGGSWFKVAHNTTSGKGRNPDGRKVPGFRFDGSGRSFQTAAVADGRKGAGAGAEWFDQNLCKLPSASPRRKMASAMIAKIPQPLARHIAATFRPAPATSPERGRHERGNM
jgi:hypothetical protein